MEKRKLFEITHPQKRIWYNEILFKDTFMHVLSFKIKITKNVDFNILKKAINEVIRENDALRLCFTEEYGKPYQYVKEYENQNIEYVDFKEFGGDAEDKFNEYFKAETKKIKFKEDTLLYKFVMYKLNSDDLGILMFAHHIIMDGASFNLILKRVGEVYKDLYLDGEHEFSEKNSYLDFIKEENSYEKSYEHLENKKFWNEKFKNLDEDSLYVNSKSVESRFETITFDLNTFKKLKEFTGKFNTSFNKFFISVLSLYSNKINGKDGVTIGSATFNRFSKNSKETVGMFAGTMPIKVKIDENLNFLEFLNSVSLELREYYKNSKYPYDQLASDLEIKKLGFDSLFKACVNYYSIENINFDLTEGSVLTFTPEAYLAEESNMSLHLFVKENKSKDEFLVQVHYRVEDYKEYEIQNMIKGIKSIVNTVLENNYKLLKDIDIVEENEKKMLLDTFNDTKIEYPRSKTIKQIFEETVNKYGDKAAIVSNGQRLTYSEVNERANKIAHILRKNGVSKNSIVPIICDRSYTTIIAMLGVLKSGGAYLPIDCEYPNARVNYMLKDSKSTILLSKKELVSKYDLSKLDINIIELSNSRFQNEPSSNLENLAKYNDLAYVIYTSGSTGNPKGVLIKNSSLIKLVKNQNYIDLKEDDKVLQSGSLSFDASVFQIFIALLNGLTLHLEDKNLILDDIKLESYIDENKITIMLMPTPLFNEFSKNRIEIFKNLRNLLVGGDVIRRDRAETLLKTYKNINLLNAYGPTENTVISTIYKVKSGKEYKGAIPIGKPISNSTAYIMNKYNNLLPIGEVGELCVGGDGLSAGYLNREDLSKEKFINNPYAKNELIYKTGDLARWNIDGEIEFVGRCDNQVKIRGFRIELEEIENHMSLFKKFKESAVAPKSDKNNNKYLCAYYVSDFEVSQSEIEEFMLNEIPSYMIPSYFIRLSKMPHNVNGKVDRKALPHPDFKNLKKEIIKPTNETEEELFKTWCEVLNTDEISIKDDFFKIGGHSLKAVSLICSINKKMNLKLNISKVFEFPTIQSFAKEILKIRKDLNGVSNISIQVKKPEEKEFYKVSKAQERIFAINGKDTKSLNYNMPFAYLIEGELNEKKLNDAFKEIVNMHSSLRTSFHVIDGQVFQKINKDSKNELEILNISEKFNEESFSILKFIKPFNLNKPQNIRGMLLKYLDLSVFVIDMHHIVSDGISMNILIDQLVKLYNDEEVLKPINDYTYFSNYQTSLYESEIIKDKEEYWKERLNGEILKLNLPYDRKKISNNDFLGDSIKFSLDKEIVNKVDTLVKELKVTKYMFYFAAFNVLLYKYTGQKEFIVGSPVSGRTTDEFLDTVGMFVNTLPIKNEISSSTTFKEYVKNFKDNLLNDLKNQDLDLLDIMKCLNTKTQPLFDVTFSYLNMFNNSLSLNRVKSKNLEIKSGISKFDLTMILSEEDTEIIGEIEYKKSLFNKKTIENFIKHYKNVLLNIINSKEEKIGNFDILESHERDIILNRFNNTECYYPKDKTVKEIFEETSKNSENKTAIVSNGRSVTFKEVNKRANILARHLKKIGVEKEEIVPVICDRSIESIISMVAIIKCGGAYLPIDCEYPKERLKYMISDSACKVILSSLKNYNELEIGDLLLKFVDFNKIDSFGEDDSNLETIQNARDLAYVIYTSGSTGKPKGVTIENRSLIKIVKNIDYLRIKEDDRLCQTGSMSFDASVLQIWLALLNGIPIHIEDKNLILNFELLEEYFNENKISILILPASLLNKIIDERPNALKNVRYIMSCGDVLLKSKAQKIGNKFKDLTIVNGYGPTENAIISTAFNFNENEILGDTVPIGKPISNSKCYIMDDMSNLCPVGVKGELCVAGEGLSRGYLNKEDLTREKFIENPYIKGEKIYKTGDLAKWLPDGNIEFLGRVDYQVKIRGFRVELGEIENAIIKCDKVKDVVVLDRKAEDGSKFLCAYVVLYNDITFDGLKKFLKNEIPNYMIPSYLIKLNEMPMTPNGKLDRHALLKMDIEKNDKDYIAPVDQIERTIQEVWKSVLNISNISTDESFFDLGGDSLKAITVISSLQKHFEIVVNDIFKYETIKELGSVLREREDKNLNSSSICEVASTKEDEENENLRYDKYKKDLLRFDKEYTKKDYKNVLLSGATGYVGVYLLRELLLNTKSNVYVLLRGDTETKAKERLVGKIKFYFKEDFTEKFKDRLKILNGDISEENLGLKSYVYENLKNKIDCIVNSAANVKHYGKYEEFYKTNVLGTKNLLDFAKCGISKDFNQISTISVANGDIKGKKMALFTEDDLDLGQVSENFYVRSKLDAEKLVKNAGNDGVNFKIFRVGNVTFNYETGRFQENIESSAFYLNVRSFIKLNSIPKSDEKNLSFCFVDELANAIISIFDKTDLKNQIFHIENPNWISLNEFYKFLKPIFKSLELKDMEEFIKYIEIKGEEDSLAKYKESVKVHLGLLDTALNTQYKIVSDRTNFILKKLGVNWDVVDYDTIKRMIDYAKKVKFI